MSLRHVVSVLAYAANEVPVFAIRVYLVTLCVFINIRRSVIIRSVEKASWVYLQRFSCPLAFTTGDAVTRPRKLKG